MKAILFTILFSIVSSASAQLKVDNMTPLRSYNHKAIIKLKKQRQLRSLANIKKEGAQEIVVSLCNENVQSLKLTHTGQLLFYRVYTENCKIEVNALDGAIISKVTL